MKNENKTQIIVWSIVTAVILALLIFALVVPKTDGNWKLFDFSFSGIGGMIVRYDNSASYTVGGGEFADVDEIELDWVAGQVNVVAYEGNLVKVVEEYDGDEEFAMYHRFQNGKLTIQFSKSGSRITNLQKQLTVYVPASAALRQLDAEVVSADVTIDSITIGQLDVECVSGNVMMNRVICEEAEFEMVSGNIEANDADIKQADVETVSGNIRLSYADDAEPRLLTVDAVSGDVTLSLPQTIGFCLNADTRRVSSDFGVSVSGNEYRFGDAGFAIDVDGVSTKVMINKKA